MANRKQVDIIKELNQQLQGKVRSDAKTLAKYSHDTSLFEVVPQAVVFPKNVNDLKKLVEFVKEYRRIDPNLSLTARSGGTDMSGGAINDSLIIGFEKYFTKLGQVRGNHITAQPGVWYRKFEKRTLQSGKLLPSFPASKDICAIGGMVANNAGGEKSLIYGKTEKYVRKLKVVLNDGNEYTIKPLTKEQLEKKMAQKDLEGRIYQKLYKLLNSNYQLIKEAKPQVAKNSTGYKLWDVWDREKGIFDLTQLFVGSQGTLGLVTETEFELVDAKKHTGMLVGFVRDLERLGELNNHILKHSPSSVEVFDDHTLNFALRFFLQFRKSLGWKKFIKLAFSFLPDVWLLRRGWPKLIILAEFEGNSASEVKSRVAALKTDLEESEFEITLEKADTKAKSERFWLMRRESFNLLRKNVKGKHTAPFVDDLVVPPKHLPEFWPKIKKILDKYGFLYTIAGHLGSGNFHIIPLMDLSSSEERAKIEPCLREVVDLVLEYGGSISGEHNDGLIRGPFLGQMYGRKVLNLFKETKEIFDPENIFNPHKKADANWQFSKKHIREKF